MTEKIDICVTAFNERENVPELVASFGAIKALLPEVVGSLVLLDNGSVDGTGDAARAIGDPNVRVVRIDPNRFYGGGMKAAILAAETDVVCILPADNQYSVEDVARVIQGYLEANSSAVMAKGRRIIREDPYVVRLLSLGYTVLTRILLRTGRIDVNGLPKVFDRTRIVGEFDRIPDRQVFDAALCALWKANGGTFVERSVTFINRQYGEASWASGKFRLARSMGSGLLAFSRELRAAERTVDKAERVSS